VKVAVSARVLDRNVGGNSRYSREVHRGGDGFESVLLRPRRGSSSAVYAAHESVLWPLSVRADVLHFPADTGAVIRGRTPIVTTVHGLGYRHAIGIRNPRAQWLWRERVRSAIRVSDMVITVSQSSAVDIMEEFGVPSERIAVIPHGVSPKFSPGEVSDAETAELRRLGFPERFMLYVGNLEPRKNVVELVKAAQATFAETGVPLVVAGALAWDFDDIVAAIDASDAVHYVGRLPEESLVPAYRSAELFCFPSKYEGFGMPVLEAMATGTAVACTLSGSLREVSEGKAFTIPGLSSAEIAPVLVEALTDTSARAQMARVGLDWARGFTWDESLRRHKEVFERVAR